MAYSDFESALDFNALSPSDEARVRSALSTI